MAQDTAEVPQAKLNTLPRADGSATYRHGGYTVTASANGPIEVQRRDEDPEEAFVDVIVRPAAGVGGPSERHLESVLQKSLQEILLVQEFPRCMIQVVLQVQAVPANDYVHTKLSLPGLNLVVLPALLQAAVLALLAASMPMRTTATAAAIAILPGQKLVSNPSPQEASSALSTHVFAFSAQGPEDCLLLAESQGAFSMDEWDQAMAAAKKICGRDSQSDGAMDVDNSDADADSAPNMHRFLRTTMQGHVEEILRWRTAPPA